MSAWEIIWTVVGVVESLIIGTVFSVLGMTPPEFKIARVCFWISAILLGGTDIMWVVQTQNAILWRVVISGLLGATIGVGLPEGIRWVYQKERAWSANKPNVSSSAAAASASSTPTPIQLPSSTPEQVAKVTAPPTAHKPAHEAATPQPTTPPQPTIVLNQFPATGNLRERALALSDDIMLRLYTHGWYGWENHIRPEMLVVRMPSGADTSARMQWQISQSNYFRYRHLQRLAQIRDEFAQLHLRDRNLDQLFEQIEAMDQTVAAGHTGNSMVDDKVILAVHIVEASESLKALAAQLR